MKDRSIQGFSQLIEQELKKTKYTEKNGNSYSRFPLGAVVVDRFPTGTKLHRSPHRLWKRERGVHGITGKPLAPLRGATAAVVDGVEFVADFTLYTHNRNTGRIVAWDTEAFAPAVARWNGAY